MTEENQQAINDTDYRSRISKFTVDLKMGLQHRIRMAAHQNDLSVSEYVGRILDQAVPDERSLGLEAIKRLDAIREQILQDRNGRPFEDSVELIRQMREKRSRELEQL